MTAEHQLAANWNGLPQYWLVTAAVAIYKDAEIAAVQIKNVFWFQLEIIGQAQFQTVRQFALI